MKVYFCRPGDPAGRSGGDLDVLVGSNTGADYVCENADFGGDAGADMHDVAIFQVELNRSL